MVVCCLVGVMSVCTPHRSEASISYPLKGSIDLTNQAIDVSLGITKDSFVHLIGKKKERNYALSLSFDHIQTSRWMFSTSLEATFDKVSDDGKDWKGKWWTRYSLVNFQPIQELSGEIEVNKGKLLFTNTILGPITLQGQVHLKAPYRFSTQALVQDIDLETLMKWWLKKKKNPYGGTVSGKLMLTGNIDHVLLKGDFVATNIIYKEWAFDKIELAMEGLYPNVLISNCDVYLPDGPQVKLSGPFNLSDEDNYKNQIAALSRKLSLGGGDSGLKWTVQGDSEDPSKKTEIKYMRRPNDLFGQRNQEEENFFGVERKLEF